MLCLWNDIIETNLSIKLRNKSVINKLTVEALLSRSIHYIWMNQYIPVHCIVGQVLSTKKKAENIQKWALIVR